MKIDNTKIKRWILPEPIDDKCVKNCKINLALQKLLLRRGFNIKNDLLEFITPLELPNPEDHFSELKKATIRLIEACNNNEQIAICGDYDADGLTSTALLVEILTKLGANAIPFIPSRNNDGYGLNIKMINNINKAAIKLVVTVDNGISAFEAIERSNELGIDLIITDHHKIPHIKQEIYALIHPERCPTYSPYKYLAGVGIAFMLAKNICLKNSYDIKNTAANDLFCIGTVADMAPVLGANRKWLKEYLPNITNTSNYGIKSIIELLKIDYSEITIEDIGFKIAPLINAVGRIDDPKLVFDLLLNQKQENSKKLAEKCMAINQQRRRMTTLVEDEAINLANIELNSGMRFLVISKKEWHTGIIGIVAARILDRFNLPTALISAANDGLYRGSIRSNDLIKVNKALQECDELLVSHGGHSAAGGFTIREENISLLKDKLNMIAYKYINENSLTKVIKPELQISLSEINNTFYNQLCILGPFGIGNPKPIFWSRKCLIKEIYYLNGNHIKFILSDGNKSIEALKWNSINYNNNFTRNELVDLAFYIELNKWQNKKKIQLNIIDIKKHTNIVDIKIHERTYKCQLIDNDVILIRNDKGQTIRSDSLKSLSRSSTKKELFSKKILSLAEIALGKAS